MDLDGLINMCYKILWCKNHEKMNAVSIIYGEGILSLGAEIAYQGRQEYLIRWDNLIDFL